MTRIGQIPKSQLYAGAGYNEFVPTPQQSEFQQESTFVDEAALTDAAEAIREVEADAIAPEVSTLSKEKLLDMNIDELRAAAKQLDVPDREQITEQDELVAAIRRCL